MVLRTSVFFYRRKQKNPKSLGLGAEPGPELGSPLDRSFEESNGGSSISGDEAKDISELVKVEINNSSDDIDNNDTVHINTNIR